MAPDSKKTEENIEQLKEIDKRLSQPVVDLGLMLFEVFPDAMIITDQQGLITHINARALMMFGYAISELVGHPIEILMPEAEREHHIKLRMNYAISPHPVGIDDRPPFEALRKDGETIKVKVGVFPTIIQDTQHFVATIKGG